MHRKSRFLERIWSRSHMSTEIWLMKGKTGMLPLDEMLPKRGWAQEPADGFQTSDGEDTWRE